MREFINRHDKGILRALEILPGLVSWNIILFPYWGIFVIPNIVAYFILAFNIYWFYQSLVITITSTVSHLRIQATMRYDWMGDLTQFPDWKKIIHVIIIVTYKEPQHTIERTINSLLNQSLPKEQMCVVIAQEDRAPDADKFDKMNYFKEKYSDKFGNFFVTLHKLSEGEVIGKASNEKSAALWIKEEFIDKRKKDINYITVTSCDADHTYHPNHFAALTYKFLDNPNRYLTFWQSAIMFYNNIWEIPAITRVQNTLGSIWNLSQLPRKDRLINQANYSLSFKLLDDVGYWDADKIPEDWGIFFKAFYKKQGKVEVEPIYLPIYVDAAQSTSFWKTMKNQYEQVKRWAWGASDDPWIIKDYFLTKDVPFLNKTMRLLTVIWGHFLWPVNWFTITIGLSIPSLINPAFGRTALGYTVPKLSSLILTIALGFLVIMLIFDYLYKPARPKSFPFWRALLVPFEFVLMPVAGFFFSALPGLDAHTRLMLGKYLEYRVTEKV